MAGELSTEMAIVSHATTSKKRSAKNSKLCLEDYIHFLHSRQMLHLNMNQLNQVIRIHGFKKIHHANRKVLADAVDTLDLIDLPRSTLNENVSAFAVLTLEEAVADLSVLNWQECCVTSIQKFSSRNGQSLFPASSDQNLGLVNLSQSQSHAHKTKRDKIRGLIPEAFNSSRLQASKMVPRRKKSGVSVLGSATSTVDSDSLASC